MRTHRSDAGFSLSALIFFATAASILMAAAVPAYVIQAKRERELELMFRGQEYMRALQKYQRKFGVYPSTVDQLLSTNNIRFLRKPYVDPITGKEFRRITRNPDGSLNGSKVFMQNINTQPLFGGQTQNATQPGQLGQQGQQGQQGQLGQLGQQGQQNNRQGQSGTSGLQPLQPL